MDFSRQGYWHGLPFPSPGDLPDPGIEPMALASPALAGRFFTTRSDTWETRIHYLLIIFFVKNIFAYTFTVLNLLLNISAFYITSLLMSYIMGIDF